MSWDKLTWKLPKNFRPPIMEEGSLKEAVLIGPDGPLKSDNIQVGILCMSANTKMPRHSEDAAEMIHILQGHEISIGFAVDDWLVKAKYHWFPATFPKVMKVKCIQNSFNSFSRKRYNASFLRNISLKISYFNRQTKVRILLQSV